MFGEKLRLITMQCCICKKMIALRVDPEDLDRHRKGVFVQDAFVDRAGTPCLTADERELVFSKVCDDCSDLLCPSNKRAYN